jgi:hypothetical protein
MAWPLGKVAAKLAAVGPGVPTAVLLSTGALNPVHRGHVDVLRRARRAVESATALKVVGGFVSPSHRWYVEPKAAKARTRYLPTEARAAAAALATADSDWLDVGRWEGWRPGFRWPDFPEVCAISVLCMIQPLVELY